jgi:hypothetical protein
MVIVLIFGILAYEKNAIESKFKFNDNLSEHDANPLLSQHPNTPPSVLESVQVQCITPWPHTHPSQMTQGKKQKFT